MRDLLKLLAFVFGGLIGLIFIVYITFSAIDKTRWNNGYHSCGGKWEYVQPIGHAYSTTFMYRCDKCGVMEEFNEMRGDL